MPVSMHTATLLQNKLQMDSGKTFKRKGEVFPVEDYAEDRQGTKFSR